MNMRWDKRMIDLAKHIASWSKDPSTKVGAVIVRPNYTICSTGYNGFPRGVNDDPKMYADRETKYERTVHAEMNAILTAPEPVTGYTLYCTLPPCSSCAKLVIQAGIKRFVAPAPEEELIERWRLDKSVALLMEANIDVLLMGKGNL